MNKDILKLLVNELLKEENDGLSSQTEEHPFLGRYVVVRTYSDGVHVGKLIYKKNNEVHLKDTRRIWRWEGAFCLSEFADDGPQKPNECRFSKIIDENYTLGVIGIIPLTPKAKGIIYNVPADNC